MIDDSNKENDPDESQGTSTDSSMDRSETTELEVQRTGGMRRPYGTKQKCVIVAYTREHSVAAATKKFSIPRTTIGRWMVDGYFERDVTKQGVKKRARRPLTYSREIDEHLSLDVREL